MSARQQPGSGVRATLAHWKAPIALGAFAAVALAVFVPLSGAGTSTFRLSTDTDLVQLPVIAVPTIVATVTLGVLLAAGAAASAWLVAHERRTFWLIALFAAVFLIDFLAWVATGKTIPIPGLLMGAVSLSTPLIYGALGGVIGERVGVVNVAIEGQFLGGAFVSAMIASVTGSAYLGLVAAMVAGVLVSMVLGAFAIKYLVDQVIVGVVLNVLVSGLTGFLYTKLLSPNLDTLNSPPRFSRISIPLLSEIPIVGPTLFRQTIIVYLMYVAVVAVWFALFKTRWGLRLRAVGEHPTAADTVGIDVARTRFVNVALAGAIAGLGGAFFTLGSVGGFTKDMTGGYGFIALAAVIFGRWHPIRATFAALLFGFATNLRSVLQSIESPVPSEFMLMLPYVITIVAVAGLVGQSRAPAASGKPYLKS
ncbi:MAG: ABC transporter permease [Microbacteriaceae bacterium]